MHELSNVLLAVMLVMSFYNLLSNFTFFSSNSINLLVLSLNEVNFEAITHSFLASWAFSFSLLCSF